MTVSIPSTTQPSEIWIDKGEFFCSVEEQKILLTFKEKLSPEESEKCNSQFKRINPAGRQRQIQISRILKFLPSLVVYSVRYRNHIPQSCSVQISYRAWSLQRLTVKGQDVKRRKKKKNIRWDVTGNFCTKTCQGFRYVAFECEKPIDPAEGSNFDKILRILYDSSRAITLTNLFRTEPSSPTGLLISIPTGLWSPTLLLK